MFDQLMDETVTSAGSVILENRETEVMTLKGSFSTNENVYKVWLKSDGTGKILYSDFPEDFEDFDHQIEVLKLAREIEEAVQFQLTLQSEQGSLDLPEIEEIRHETTTDILTDVFWEQINDTLEDPFFRFSDDDDWGEEFRCENGTVEELTDFLKICVLTEREITDARDFLIVEAETEIDNACLSDCSYYSERLAELVEIAVRYYEPKGFTYDYNDGCYDRMSGYCLSSETISISLAEFSCLPVREKMLGMKELRRKLEEMGVAADRVEQLTAF